MLPDWDPNDRDWRLPNTSRIRQSTSTSHYYPRHRFNPPTHSSPVVATAAGPSHQANPRLFQAALDESARVYRTTALQQLNGSGRSHCGPSRWHRHYPNRQSTTSAQNGSDIEGRNRSSGLVTQPILVRTYSGNSSPGESKSAGKKPVRRGASSSTQMPQGPTPKLPSPEDFSVANILRTIEPNIQHTLDSIAEIYGRSKLSLANEYGSHIAPLGEIRGPTGPGYLVTVDEASSELERQQQEDDEEEHARQTDNANRDRLSVQAEPDTPRSSTDVNPVDLVVADEVVMPIMKDFTSTPTSSGKQLLRGRSDSTEGGQLRIVTPAVVSVVHLDARAENPHPLIGQGGVGNGGPWSSMVKLRPLLSWMTAWRWAGSCQRRSAEVQLRTLLGS